MMELMQRLEDAVASLTGAASLKDRLLQAYCQHLSELQAADFPESIRDDFLFIFNVLHKERAMPGENTIKASVRKLSLEEAQQCTTRIMTLYSALARSAPQARGQSPRAVARFPAFLAQEGATQSNLNSMVSQRVVSS